MCSRSCIKTGSEIGGEQSGHIIFPEISLVGDGMMTALLVLRAIVEEGRFAFAGDGWIYALSADARERACAGKATVR